MAGDNITHGKKSFSFAGVVVGEGEEDEMEDRSPDRSHSSDTETWRNIATKTSLLGGLVAEIMVNFQHLSNICPILNIT